MAKGDGKGAYGRTRAGKCRKRLYMQGRCVNRAVRHGLCSEHTPEAEQAARECHQREMARLRIEMARAENAAKRALAIAQECPGDVEPEAWLAERVSRASDAYFEALHDPVTYERRDLPEELLIELEALSGRRLPTILQYIRDRHKR